MDYNSANSGTKKGDASIILGKASAWTLVVDVDKS
jgi:hypothetical protein